MTITDTTSTSIDTPVRMTLRQRLRDLVQRQRVLLGVVVIVILLIVGGSIRPGFISLDNIGSLVAIASILTLLSCSQVFVIVAGGEGIDLSVAAVASMSAVLSSMLLSRAGADVGGGAGAILLVLVISALIGLVNGIGVTFANVPPLVMTLGMAQLVAGGIFAYASGSAPSSAPPWLSDLGAGRAIGPLRWLVVIVVVLVVLGELWLRRTRAGRALFLVGTNVEAARLSGIGIRSVRLSAYVASSVVGSAAGILLLGSAGSAQLGMADGYLLLSVAAVIIGGARFTGGEGSFVGAAVGAVMLTVLDSLLIIFGLGAGERTSVQGVILLALTLVYARERSLRS